MILAPHPPPAPPLVPALVCRPVRGRKGEAGFGAHGIARSPTSPCVAVGVARKSTSLDIGRPQGARTAQLRPKSYDKRLVLLCWARRCWKRHSQRPSDGRDKSAACACGQRYSVHAASVKYAKLRLVPRVRQHAVRAQLAARRLRHRVCHRAAHRQREKSGARGASLCRVLPFGGVLPLRGVLALVGACVRGGGCSLAVVHLPTCATQPHGISALRSRPSRAPHCYHCCHVFELCVTLAEEWAGSAGLAAARAHRQGGNEIWHAQAWPRTFQSPP